MAEQEFYKTWKMRLQTIPHLRRFQQPGIGRSYPVFAYTEGGLLVRHFHHTAERSGPDSILLGPARVLVTLDFETFENVDLNFEAFDLPLFEDVEFTLNAEERAALRPDIQRLEALYDELLATYPEPPDSDVVEDFAATLQRVVPPVLWPYYEQLLGDHVPASQ
jgi:hypothetical protein